jgi:hypothetical protein
MGYSRIANFVENILPEKSVFNDFEVTHTFEILVN